MLITIGSFDGFHRGHAELLRICRDNAAPKNNWGVLTFEPHPSVFMGKLKKTLFTLQERELIRNVLAVPQMFVLRFDETLMNLSPENFCSLISRKFNVDGLVMGSDFHFGALRSGNAQLIERTGMFSKILTVPLKDKTHFSSSNIRKNILTGNVKQAAQILGYPYFVIRRIVGGDRRGRTLGFPTANLEMKNDRVFPSEGVYACGVFLQSERRWYCGAMSVGKNPTFDKSDGEVRETRAEVNILDFEGDIYGKETVIMFLERVRDIRKFSGKEELSAQIERDTLRCREIYEQAVREKEVLRFSERVREQGMTVTPEVRELLQEGEDLNKC